MRGTDKDREIRTRLTLARQHTGPTPFRFIPLRETERCPSHNINTKIIIMYKKITLDYLIRIIRAINQGEKLEFSTAPYDGGLNYTILHTSILDEDYVAVVAPSISEKAFLVYGPDICGPFWEDDFKDLLMSLPLELRLDDDCCPYVKTEELEHFLQQHPDLAPADKEAWSWHDEEDISPEELTMLEEYFQPRNKETKEPSEDLMSFMVFPSEKSCREWLKDNVDDPDGHEIVRMSADAITNPSVMYRFGKVWLGYPLCTLKVVSDNEETCIQFPDVNDETENTLDLAKAALDLTGKFGHILSIELIPEDKIDEEMQKTISCYFAPKMSIIN